MPYADPDKAREASRVGAARYRQRHPERARAAKRRHTIGPEERERRRAAQREWYQRHRADPVYRAEASARMAAWRRSHPEAVRLSNHKQRSRKGRRRGESAKLDIETREYLGQITADPCAYCGGAADTDDHIVPLAHGGDHHWSNFTRACGSCNSRKHDRSLLLVLLGT